MIFSVEFVYYLIGAIIIWGSIYTFKDQSNPKRFTSGAFYLIYGLAVMLAGHLPPMITGILVLALVVIVASGGLKIGSYKTTTVEEKVTSQKRLGKKLLIPVLLIPFVTIVISVFFSDIQINGLYVFDQEYVTLTAMTTGIIIAFIVGIKLTKDTPTTSIKESRRLLEAIGWAAILPQMLSILGTVFTESGVGVAVSNVVEVVVPTDSLFWCVFAYCVGMALFTMVMGNAFAAFPVITAGIAIPFLIGDYGMDPNQVAAIGMFSGYCGTLMTPMAANYNIVPAALLDLKDQNHVIKVQVPTGLIILAFNIILMYLLGAR